MTKKTQNQLPEVVSKRAESLEKHLVYIASKKHILLSEHELTEAYQNFLIRCWEVYLQYQDGQASVQTYLFEHTRFEAEQFLRSRRQKKKLMLKEAQGLYDLDDEEYLPDEKSDFLSDLFYEETRQQIYNNLTVGELALIDALLDAKGNVAKAARIMGIDESKARRMRKSIQKKCDFLEK